MLGRLSGSWCWNWLSERLNMMSPPYGAAANVKQSIGISPYFPYGLSAFIKEYVMDRKRAYIIWFVMAVAITFFAYLFGATWYWALIIGVLSVAAIVGMATGAMYWKQKKLFENAAKFNIDLKNGKIHPADLRRMYFSGGKARKDALFIASQAMQCSVQEAEKRLSERVNKQAANQEMMRQQSGGKQRRGRPR